METPEKSIMSYSDEEVEQGHYRGFDEEKEEMRTEEDGLTSLIWGIILLQSCINGLYLSLLYLQKISSFSSSRSNRYIEGDRARER